MKENTSSQYFRELFRVLIRKLGILERENAVCCNITLSQCHAIVEVGRAPDLSLNDLAAALDLNKSTVSRIVDQLAEKNILIRKIDVEDRRYVALHLSEEGDILFNTIETYMNAYFQKVLQAVPPDKRVQVIESLQILQQVLDKNHCC
jgi:DNA-binding MarR family transcriptional regulator